MSPGLSYSKATMVCVGFVLCVISAREKYFVQALMTLILLIFLSLKENGDARMLFPLLFLSERCFLDHHSTGHSPIIMYSSFFMAFLQTQVEKEGIQGATLYTFVLVSVLAFATRAVFPVVGLIAFVAGGLTAFLRLRKTSFSERESILISQFVAIIVHGSICNISLNPPEGMETAIRDPSRFREYSNISLTSFPHVASRSAILSALIVALSCSMLSNVGWWKLRFNATTTFFLVLSAVLTLTVMYVWVVFGENPFIWLTAYLISRNVRLFLLLFWMAFIPLGLVFFALFGQPMRRLFKRKVFHLIAVVSFAPVVFIDAEFLSMSISGAFALGILLETARVVGVEGTSAVSRYFEVFIDHRDEHVARTHLYLLFGFAASIFLTTREEIVIARPVRPDVRFALHFFPGVICLGVLDSLAAVVGTLYQEKSITRRSRSSHQLNRVNLAYYFCGSLFPVAKNTALSHKSFAGSGAALCGAAIVWTSICVFSHFSLFGATSGVFLALGCVWCEATLSGVDNLELPIAATVLTYLFGIANTPHWN